MKTETKLPVNENEKEQKKNEWEKNKQKNANCCFFNWFFSVDLSIIIFPVYEWRMRKRLVDGFFFSFFFSHLIFFAICLFVYNLILLFTRKLNNSIRYENRLYSTIFQLNFILLHIFLLFLSLSYCRYLLTIFAFIHAIILNRKNKIMTSKMWNMNSNRWPTTRMHSLISLFLHVLSSIRLM